MSIIYNRSFFELSLNVDCYTRAVINKNSGFQRRYSQLPKNRGNQKSDDFLFQVPL